MSYHPAPSSNPAPAAEYVVGRSGVAMRWEQPIPGSGRWQVTYIGQLPPGEFMTDREWAEVAAASGGAGEVTGDLFNHPDPWMDNEPGSLTIPHEWPRQSSGNYKSKWKRYKRNLRWKSTMRKVSAEGFDPYASPFNDCSRCGQNMGQGMSGFDKETQKAICMDCWRASHPAGLPPHPNVGIDVPRADSNSLHDIVPNDERWSRSTARESMSHGLTPCPYCGGDIQEDRHGGRFVCSGCRHVWPTGTDAEFNRSMQQIHPGNLDTRTCPKCGSTMHWRDGAGLGRMWPNGAWECSNQRCWHMAGPGEMMPDTYQDPDAPGDFTLPEGFQ